VQKSYINQNFYSKFGFVPAKSYGVEPLFPIPDEVFLAIELEKKSLDGLNGKIQYRKVFDTVT
jgi:putative acetyltransferase